MVKRYSSIFTGYNIVFLFVFYQLLALYTTFNFSIYHHSIFSNYFQEKIIVIQEFSDEMESYLYLEEQNKLLLQENAELLERLNKKHTKENKTSKVNYISAKVLSKSISGLHNYLLLNKGKNHGVLQNMGFFNTKGIIGIVKTVGENYSIVAPIIHTAIKIPAKHKKSNHFGFTNWNGENDRIVFLEDIPKYANIKNGDTIVTDYNSEIFFEGIPIGTVTGFNIIEYSNHYQIRVKLFVDFKNIRSGYLLNKKDTDRIKKLEEEYINEY